MSFGELRGPKWRRLISSVWRAHLSYGHHGLGIWSAHLPAIFPLTLGGRVLKSWKKFLSRLDSIHLCTFVDEQSSEEDVSALSQFIDGGTYNATSNDKAVSITVAASLFLMREFKKFSLGMMAVTGRIEVEGLSQEAGDVTSLNMTFVVPQNLTETKYRDACVILTGPSWLLPLSRRSKMCIPSPVNRTITHAGALFPVKPDDAPISCRNGSSIRLSYNSQADDEFYLSKEERWNIYIRLIHASYFLFILAVTFMCYSLVRGRLYMSVVKVDKVPLTL